MDIRTEIKLRSSEEDKPVLHWLFNRYYLDWQWRFVARCTFERFGPHSYQVRRIWTPTEEGRALHRALS